MSWIDRLKQKFRRTSTNKQDMKAKALRTRRTTLIDNESMDIGTRLTELKTMNQAVITWLKNEGVSRGWFMSQFKDTSPEIVNKLDEVLQILRTSKIPGSQPIIKQLLTLKHREVLKIVKEHGSMSPSKLGDILKIKRNTACEHLRRLEKLGHVQRTSRGIYEPV